MRPPLGVFRLIVASLRLLGAHFGVLFGFAFAPGLAGSALSYALVPTAPGAEPAALGAGSVLAFLAVLAIGSLAGGLLALVALDLALGKRHALGAYLSQTLRHAGPLIVLGFLVGVATGLGALLLVVPGLYLYARYLPLTPGIVFENAGWSGLGRAQALSEGYRWPLAGALVVLVCAIAAVAVPVSALIASLALPVAVTILAEAAVQSVIMCLSATFGALAYLRLRELNEGASAADVAATIG